jgi:hypothetical protein
VRLCGEVAYDDKKHKPEIYWFDVPEQYSEYLSESGNPWAACLLPLAVTLGEPLRLCRPIDRLLFENASDLVDIWASWHSHLRVIPIEADLIVAAPHGHNKTAAFFSGGVDSFFTALRNQEHSIRSTPIDDFIHVWGFDILLKHEEAYQRMISRLRIAASALGKELVEVSTNLRATRLDKTGWGSWDGWGALYHASALASVGLALEKRYAKVLINSASGYRFLHPWGSHPLTDPLLTTSQTRIIHYGAASGRIQKIEYLTKHDVALQNLHVCPKLGTDASCGNCRKCYYTMTAILLFGAFDRCRTFNKIEYDVRKLEHMYSADDCDRAGVKALQELAVKHGRLDIAKALQRSFANTDRVDRWRLLAYWCKERLSGMRFAWRYADVLEKMIVKKALT